MVRNCIFFSHWDHSCSSFRVNRTKSNQTNTNELFFLSLSWRFYFYDNIELFPVSSNFPVWTWLGSHLGSILSGIDWWVQCCGLGLSLPLIFPVSFSASTEHFRQTWNASRCKMSVAGLKKQFHKASQVWRRLLLLVHNNNWLDVCLQLTVNKIRLQLIIKLLK